MNQYKILSPIGAGGMGEVYLAHDNSLRRKAALKFLSAEVAADKERLHRFEQEAFAASALNHPNILTIYEFGKTEGVNYLATEYVEGKTLRDKLESGALDLEEALHVAEQIAFALSAAHASGIVRRDLKPENVMIRADGIVKVLDFGLAKLLKTGAPFQEQSASADDETRAMFKTHLGAVMGTVNYMSPEQARGKDIDARSDIFSFGIVLYEILTGRAPFGGETITDILAAIINSEPAPLASFAPHVPRSLQSIVDKTLRKQRDERYPSTGDLLNELKELRDELRLGSRLERSSAPNQSETIRMSATNLSRTSSGSRIKDPILLTEFENSTGETIFDQTLKMALAFSLAQSPFMDIFPEAKINQALHLMRRTANERVTKDLGYVICQRQGLKAFIAGTISSFGSMYVLTLEAINVRSGESLGREFEQITSREEVLNALSRAASGLREKLGESLSSIESYGAPIGYITTPSLEALKYFTLGLEQSYLGKDQEVIPFYKKAIEIDPKFSSVYMGMAVIYSNTGQWKLAAEMAEKAFELRETMSENEKLRVMFFYYRIVTGEIEKAVETLELWRKTYPSHISAIVNMA